MGRPAGVKNKPKGDTVQTQTADRTETTADQATSRGQVAVFQPPRLPYHDAVQERFGVDKGQWKVLVEAIFPAAKSVDSIVMVLSYCKTRNLDPFKRPVHIVPMWDSARGAYVETVWPGISEMRTTASRTQGYAGCDEAEFGPEKTFKFKGRVKRSGNWEDAESTVTVAEWCRITVYRIIAGQRCKFVGPKVKWVETYAAQGASELPNKMWEKRSEGQLEKCAEAAALRRAFPEEIGNELTAEEMTGKSVHDLAVDIAVVDQAAGAPPNADAGPPRQIAAKPVDQPHDAEQARDGTPPPRQPKAAPKEDPISTGGPPRAAAKPETGPSDPGPKPHRVPGDGHTFETWAEKYCDLIQTSPDIATVYGWIDINTKEFSPGEGKPMQIGPLTRLNKFKPSVYAAVKTTTEKTMAKLRTEQEKATAKTTKKAAAAATPPSDMDDSTGGEMNDAAPTNPEEILAAIDQELQAVEDPDQLQDVWDRICEPLASKLEFPPDQDAAQGVFNKHEKRLGGD